jgi:hypothetical protein
MANTTRFMIEIPDVGADADMWGTILNNYFNALEPKIFDRSAGDTVSGPLTVTGLTSVTTLNATGVLNTPAVNGATTLRLQTGGVDRVTVDAAGNAGLGVVPSAWGSSYRSLDMQNVGAFFAEATGNVGLGFNTYYSASEVPRYKLGIGAFSYRMSGEGHEWRVAPVGTAGAPITFTQAMTLTQGGNQLLGDIVDKSARLYVQGGQTTTTLLNSSPVLTVRNNASGADVRIQISDNVANSVDVGLNQGSLYFATAGAERARITSGGNFRPGADNAYSLGEPSFRWSVVYAATGTINTSDERAKLDFAPTLGLDFITALEPVSYRYKNSKTVIEQVEDGTEEVPAVLDEDGNEVTPATTKPKYKSVERVIEGTRRHHGLKAQQVKSTLDKFGADFAGWVLENPDDPNSGQGLRYDQFIAPLIKAVQELSAQNSALTDRIAVLEAK